jgi:hypothetical protein
VVLKNVTCCGEGYTFKFGDFLVAVFFSVLFFKQSHKKNNLCCGDGYSFKFSHLLDQYMLHDIPERFFLRGLIQS